MRVKGTEHFSMDTALGPQFFLLELSYTVTRRHLVTSPVAVLVYLTVDVVERLDRPRQLIEGRGYFGF